MDDDEDVACIEAPFPTHARTHARLLAMAGQSESVFTFNGEGSKSASSSVRAEKFKKQRRAHREFVWPGDWSVVRRYPTGGRMQLEAEDIDFDIYKQTRELMKPSGMKMLPEQEVQASSVHLLDYGNFNGRQTFRPTDMQFEFS
jgi:hypothetical protein